MSGAPLRLYAVAIADRFLPTVIEFYWAKDRDHALGQATEAHPFASYSIALVPHVEPREEEPR